MHLILLSLISKKTYKEFIIHLFSFSVLKEILTFYVLLISILTILVAVKIFDIQIEPIARILKPVYVYNMYGVNKIFQNDTLRIKTESFPRLKYNLYDNKYWKSLLIGYYYEYNDWQNYSNKFASYEMFDKSKKINETFGYQLPDEWYLWGFINKSKYLVNILTDLDAAREDEIKMYNLGLLLNMALRYEADSLKQSDSSLISKTLDEENRLTYNPLSDLVMCDSVNLDCSNLIYNISNNMLIYSCISICNFNNQSINNINLILSDIFRYGRYSLIGWTKMASISSIKQNPKSIELTIDRLEPGKSIEILFRGDKYILNTDINLSGSYLSNIDVTKIKLYLVLTLLFVLILYFFLWILYRNKSTIHLQSK